MRCDTVVDLSAKRTVTTVCLVLCFCVLGLYAYTQPCHAQNPVDAADNQTLPIRFISLKPGNTIGASNLHLHAEGTLDFSIEDETLTNTTGTWSIKTNRFSARIDFTIDKQACFHYRLQLDGYCLLGMYAGTASLLEYNHPGRLTQHIRFLFYALPPGMLNKLQK